MLDVKGADHVDAWVQLEPAPPDEFPKTIRRLGLALLGHTGRGSYHLKASEAATSPVVPVVASRRCNTSFLDA